MVMRLFTRPLACLLLACVCLIAGAPCAQALVVQASAEPTQVEPGDSITLMVRIDQAANDKEPNFAALEKNFSILGRQASQNTRILNGSISTETTWTLSLRPKGTGTLTIPPISFDGATSKPLTITVKDNNPANKRPGEALVFLDMKVDKPEPYVQEQVIVTLKLLQRVPTNDPTFVWSEGEGYIREKLGDARTYQSEIDGYNYDVTEHRFALFPQKSGDIKLPVAEFGAFIAVMNSNMFDPFLNQMGKQISRHSQEIVLHVKPKPTDFPADAIWLPSPQLLMQDKISPDKTEFKVGEPVTRTITLQAFGIAQSVLPPLPVPESPLFKVYPEKGRTQSGISDGSYVSQRIETQAFIPTRGGELTLPAVEVTYWNTTKRALDRAVLPARKVMVTAPSTTQGADAASAPPQSLERDPAPGTASLAAPAPTSAAPGGNTTHAPLWQVLTGAFLLAWLATLFAWWRLRRHLRPAATDPDDPTTSASTAELRQKLMEAASSHNPVATRKALLAWYSAFTATAHINSLGQLGKLAMSALLVRAVAELEAHLYSPPGGNPWRSDNLRKAIADEESQRRIKKHQRQPALSALYPKT